MKKLYRKFDITTYKFDNAFNFLMKNQNRKFDKQFSTNH